MLNQGQFFNDDAYLDPQKWMEINRAQLPTSAPTEGEQREGRRLANRGRWASMGLRIDDENAHDMLASDPGMAGASPIRTTDEYGLRSTSGLSKDPNWKQGDPFRRVPTWATFEGSSRAGWRRHAIDAEVNLNDLVTPQGSVASSRVQELLEHPERASSPRLPYTEKLRVWRDDTSPDDVLIDGNHRATAAIARGEMFQPAQIATPAQQLPMHQAAIRLRRNIEQAEYMHGRGRNPFDNVLT